MADFLPTSLLYISILLLLSNGNKTIPQWYGCKNKNTLKRTKIKSMNTDAISMLKIKKPKYQFEIIFTYSFYNHAIKLLSRCSTKFVGPSTPPRWILGGSNLVHDTTTTMPGPCSQKSLSPREGRGHWRRRRSAVGNTWAGWGSIPVVFSLAWQVTRVSSCVRRPFPSKEIRRISERDDPGPPVCHKTKRRMGV